MREDKTYLAEVLNVSKRSADNFVNAFLHDNIMTFYIAHIRLRLVSICEHTNKQTI